MRSPFFLLLAALGVAAFLAGCNDAAKQQAAPPPPPPAEVSVVTLKAQSVTLTTDLAGRTSPYEIAEVRPQVGGVLQDRLFEEGAEVAAGQPLYQIDPAPYKAALDNATASRDRAKATIESSRNLARRNQNLVNAGAVSKQEAEDAAATQHQAEADLAAAEAAVRTAQINLDYARILSPIAGRTGRSLVTKGALVTANQANALVVIQRLDPIYVDIVQPSAQLLRLRRAVDSGAIKSGGDGSAAADLLLEDGSDYGLQGKLQFSEVTVDEGTGSVTLRAVFPNPKRLLLPGMFVHARIREGVAENALLVPQRAVTYNPKGDATAMVVDGDGKAALRVVKIDRAVGNAWLVHPGPDSGLQAGDRVIVEGLQKAPPGAPVHATEFQAAPAAAPAPAQG
ncbi:MAG TPA: efflux RND transporter periplasmic adaptor subunit [Candidatus Methylacidiphilales bacterium]